MRPKELAEAMCANKKFRDKTTGIVFVFISVDGEGNVVGFTEDGNFAESHAKNLEVEINIIYYYTFNSKKGL